MKKKSFGFTFIELLVVIVIMATVFAIGLANYRGFTRQKQLENAARQVEGDLRFALSAANAGEGASACGSGFAIDRYQVVFSSDSYDINYVCKQNTNETNISVKSDIGFENISFSSATVIFYTVGRGASSTTVTITQDSTGNSYHVIIGAGGEIKVSSQ